MTTHSLLGGMFIRCLSWLPVLILSARCLASAAEPALLPHVDPRVEVVSIVFRLTGEDSDYNKTFLKAYASDIDAYFSPFKTHPAVLLAKKLAERDDFDVAAPMQIAVRVSSPPALEPLLPFTNDVPGDGFDKETAVLFLQRLREFYRDTHFERFFAAHQVLYRLAENRFDAVLREVDLNWYPSFYGEAQESSYHIILALNNGSSNYGAQFTVGDGHEERFSIMGSWTTDKSGNPTYTSSTYFDTVTHEFNHSFVNPAFDRHKADFAAAQKVFAQLAGQMHSQEYTNSDIMVYESLVRVNVILYLASKGRSRADLQAKIRDEQKRGFLWMDELYDFMDQYTSQRSRYPTFDSFMPVVAQFYRDLPQRLAGMKANFYKNYVHVTAVEPFPNHSHDVDPGTREIIVKFDKPLVCCHYSINYGPDGKEHFPIVGTPAFLGGNQSMKLTVALKPGSHYSFTLTDESFASQDGFPLESYTIDFDTKP
jgi:uncharacterized protein DUF4932